MLVPTTRKAGLFRREMIDMLFVHVPKCGGSFVEEAFVPWIRRCPSQTLPAAAGHRTWLEYKDAFYRAGIDVSAMKTFSVIRNPWDWQVSVFHYSKQDKKGKRTGKPELHERLQAMSFSDYLNWLLELHADGAKPPYDVWQLRDYVVDEQGALVPEFILRQETLAQDLLAMASALNLAIRPVKRRVNASKRDRDYRAYFSDADAEAVAKLHADDIQMFGYTF